MESPPYGVIHFRGCSCTLYVNEPSADTATAATDDVVAAVVVAAVDDDVDDDVAVAFVTHAWQKSSSDVSLWYGSTSML
jgi:hypothetical protein